VCVCVCVCVRAYARPRPRPRDTLSDSACISRVASATDLESITGSLDVVGVLLLHAKFISKSLCLGREDRELSLDPVDLFRVSVDLFFQAVDLLDNLVCFLQQFGLCFR
jgi:hypothetical protein